MARSPQLCGYQPRPAKVWVLGSAGSSPLPAPGLLDFPLKATRQTPPDDAGLESRRSEGSWMNYELMIRSSADDGSLISDFLRIRCTCGNCVITKQWAPVHLQVVLVSPNPGLMWVSGERAPAGLVPKLMLQPSLYCHQHSATTPSQPDSRNNLGRKVNLFCFPTQPS